MREKKIPAVIFTADATFLTTWIGSPSLNGETARCAISRSMCARLLLKTRRESTHLGITRSCSIINSPSYRLDCFVAPISKETHYIDDPHVGGIRRVVT